MSPDIKDTFRGDDRPKSGRGKDSFDLSKGPFRWAGFGLELAGVMGLFCYGGYRLDQRWQTQPWLMVTGAGVAFAGMMYLLVKETRPWQK